MSPASKAHLEGNKRYLEKLDEIKFRVPKGRKDEIKAAADAVGESVNGYISQAVDERMERETPVTVKVIQSAETHEPQRITVKVETEDIDNG